MRKTKQEMLYEYRKWQAKETAEELLRKTGVIPTLFIMEQRRIVITNRNNFSQPEENSFTGDGGNVGKIYDFAE